MRLRPFVPILFFLTISCAPFSQEVMKEVDRDIPFPEVLKNPEAFRGKGVLWGGVIVETVNRQEDSLVVVMQTELDFQKRPKDLDRSPGRFIARRSGFLDPAIFGKGREVTVAGTVAGREERPVGQVLYAYPLVDALDIRLWDKIEPVPYDPWFWGPYPYWGYPYWRRHPYGW